MPLICAISIAVSFACALGHGLLCAYAPNHVERFTRLAIALASLCTAGMLIYGLATIR